MEAKESLAETPPFDRLKIRLKKEIVTFGRAIDPDRPGTYISPREWNALLQDPETIAIDTRNDYEVRVGTFRGAHDPQTQSFREFPDYARDRLDPQQHKKLALFCTGGIRCEKATAYLLQQGFEEVYHLKGGILKYLEEIPPEESLWEGECFVFDDRVTVGPDLAPGSYELCGSCGEPIAAADKASPYYEEGICCPYCFEGLTEERRSRLREKQKQARLERQRDRAVKE